MLIKDVPAADWGQLFNDTFLLSKERGWVYVSNIGHDALSMSVDGKCTEAFIKMEDETLAITSPNLGYVNVAGSVVYLSRTPKRIMKAAVSPQALQLIGVPNRKVGIRGEELVDLLRRLRRSLVECFDNKYPSLTEALEKVKDDEIYAVAFDRQFAITSNMQILYRGSTIVGEYIDGKIVFSPKYSTLNFSGEDYGQTLQAAKKAARERIGRPGN